MTHSTPTFCDDCGCRTDPNPEDWATRCPDAERADEVPVIAEMRIVPARDRFGQKTLWKLVVDGPFGPNGIAVGNIFQMLRIRSEIEAQNAKNRA